MFSTPTPMIRFSLLTLLLAWTGSAAAQPMAPAASAESKPDDILMSAPGGITVTEEDIQRYIVENIPEDKRAVVTARPNFFKEMVESLYIMRALAAEAEQVDGYDKEQAAWAAEMRHKRRIVTEYRARYTQEQLVGMDWSVRARETYLANKDSYLTPETVRVEHILISAQGDEETAAAKAKLAEYRQRLEQGEDFQTLAKQVSDDPSVANNGGDMGYFGRGQMVKSFEDAAFAMTTPGSLSEPVETEFGVHLIKFIDRKASRQQTYEEVEATLVDELQRTEGGQVWQRKIISLRSEPGLSYDDARLEEMSKQAGSFLMDQIQPTKPQ